MTINEKNLVRNENVTINVGGVPAVLESIP